MGSLRCIVWSPDVRRACNVPPAMLHPPMQVFGGCLFVCMGGENVGIIGLLVVIILVILLLRLL